MSHVDILDRAFPAETAPHPWVARVGRAGLAARGLVYVMVGALAAQRAVGAGGDTTDPRGAMRHVPRNAPGDALLVLIAAGLLAYAVWRFMQAIHDTEGKGGDAKGLAVRAAFLAKGAIHLLLAVTPVRLLAEGHDGGGGSMRSWTGRVMSHEWGAELVAVIGLVVVGAGLYQVWKGWGRGFADDLDTGRMGPAMRRWSTRSGTLGYVARGITFLIVGWFFLRAAQWTDPGQARGLGDVLAVLLEQPHGPWLLGVVAMGLVAYGLHSLVEARYRRIPA